MTSSNRAHGAALEPLVRKLGYWVKLDAADRAAVLALPHTVHSLAQRHSIVREGERTTFSCLMLSGYSFRYKLVANGQRQIVSIHMQGEMVDLQNSLLGVADHSVEMLDCGKVALIPRDHVLHLAFERPNVGKAMWIDTLVDASIFREWIANVGRRDARTRIAHLLCEFALRLKVAGSRRRDWLRAADNPGATCRCDGPDLVHVNRTLKGLELDGLFDRSSARSIHIGDWRKMTEAADFDSNYLHLTQQKRLSADRLNPRFARHPETIRFLARHNFRPRCRSGAAARCGPHPWPCLRRSLELVPARGLSRGEIRQLLPFVVANVQVVY